MDLFARRITKMQRTRVKRHAEIDISTILERTK